MKEDTKNQDIENNSSDWLLEDTSGWMGVIGLLLVSSLFKEPTKSNDVDTRLSKLEGKFEILEKIIF